MAYRFTLSGTIPIGRRWRINGVLTCLRSFRGACRPIETLEERAGPSLRRDNSVTFQYHDYTSSLAVDAPQSNDHCETVEAVTGSRQPFKFLSEERENTPGVRSANLRGRGNILPHVPALIL